MNLRSAAGNACLVLVHAACSSAVGDADAGPNPGGGYYGGPNANVGHVNPGAAAMRAGYIQLSSGVNPPTSVRNAADAPMEK
jgi:hypothetical protein